MREPARSLIAQRLTEILLSPQFSALGVDAARLDDDTSLLNDLLMDSIQLLDFIVEMERAFGFRASSRELTIDVFDRFADVVAFVEKTLEARQAGAAQVTHV
jgi:acyl carrier protein